MDINKYKGPLEGKTIMIDPGHGLYPKQKGNTRAYQYQREKYGTVREDIITITMAKKLIPMLENQGAEVLCTRAYDIDEHGESGHPQWEEGTLLNLWQSQIIPNNIKKAYGSGYRSQDVNVRWQLANNANKHRGVDLFLSLHFNAGGGHGCEAFYCEGNGKTEKLAEMIVSKTVKNNPGLKSRGAKSTKKYAVITKTEMPAVLWEGAFFDSKEDRELFLTDSRFYERSANALKDSIIEWFA